ncbi:KRAB-A domain-containing protein 2 [Plakobranchus ocellatus]|uniref:KRAB-A domain-containing protein 2 n=1 Tax=Plakobranchus ocellatus TaxID=259542 RepID=A0AAV3YL78_9GAST|nr:KRAB-A domain-containing protein 2 [Plakobranchus ocellatus]
MEVASHPLDFFLLLDASALLQSDNGTEFTAHIISELKEFWPSLKLVHGKPRYPHSQGSVERANADSTVITDPTAAIAASSTDTSSIYEITSDSGGSSADADAAITAGIPSTTDPLQTADNPASTGSTDTEFATLDIASKLIDRCERVNELEKMHTLINCLRQKEW